MLKKQAQEMIVKIKQSSEGNDNQMNMQIINDFDKALTKTEFDESISDDLKEKVKSGFFESKNEVGLTDLYLTAMA